VRAEGHSAGSGRQKADVARRSGRAIQAGPNRGAAEFRGSPPCAGQHIVDRLNAAILGREVEVAGVDVAIEEKPFAQPVPPAHVEQLLLRINGLWYSGSDGYDSRLRLAAPP
jgi:hypothetical protein